MKHYHTALLIAFIITLGSLSARAEVYDLSTTAGKTYRQCHVLKIELDGLSFKHSNGIAKILFKDLTPEWRQHFGYDAEKARAHEQKQKDDKAKALEVALKRAQEFAKVQQEEMNTARENSVLQALQFAMLRNGGGGGYSGFWGMSGFAMPTQFYNEQQIVDGRFYSSTRRIRGSGDLVAGACFNNGQIAGSRSGWRGAATPRYFSTGYNANGYSSVPFFAVPGIGPNVAPMAAPMMMARPPCAIRGSGAIMGH